VVEVVAGARADLQCLAARLCEQLRAHLPQAVALARRERPVVDRGEDRMAGHARNHPTSMRA
jgi:hypothetical protein